MRSIMHKSMTKAITHLFTAEESRAIDARAISDLPVSGFTLMQRAAEVAFSTLLQRYPGITGISVWGGKGNNAGDAYLVAALARRYGLAVQAVAAAPTAELNGDAARAWQQAAAAGVEAVPFDSQPVVGDVLVDGLLGTGFSGEPRPGMREVLQHLQQVRQPVLSVDVPSGVNASTGAAAACAVRADATVSFITRKLGLHTGAGVEHAGVRVFDALGVPAHIYEEAGVRGCRFQAADLMLPSAGSHKHQQGHVMIVGGDKNMPGAVAMAAEAALRAGAGMVTVVTQASHTNAIVARTPEVMVVDAQADDLAQTLRRGNIIVLGPGLGRRAWGETLFDLVQSLGASADAVPVLLDADGLYWLARKSSWQGGPLYITPHAAEAARLLDLEVGDVQQDRLAAAAALRGRWSCSGVLKGAGSVIFSASGSGICEHGNAGMATAGMGDVLSGIAGGLLAGVQRVSAAQAGRQAADRQFELAVTAHSAAADRCAQRLGMRSLIATDVIRELPVLFNAQTAASS